MRPLQSIVTSAMAIAMEIKVLNALPRTTVIPRHALERVDASVSKLPPGASYTSTVIANVR